jgi:hypothetical protein
MNRTRNVKMNRLAGIVLGAFAGGWLASGAGVPTNALVLRAPADMTSVGVVAGVVTDTNLLEEVTFTKGIILNFHDVPLSTVLNYLSAKAGLIIVSDVDLNGIVTVANNPVQQTRWLVCSTHNAQRGTAWSCFWAAL